MTLLSNQTQHHHPLLVLLPQRRQVKCSYIKSADNRSIKSVLQRTFFISTNERLLQNL